MGTHSTKSASVLAPVVLVLLLSVFLTSCGTGGASTSASTDPTPVASDVEVPSTLDFGVVKVNSSKAVQFAIKNPSANAIVIQRVDIAGAGFSISNLSLPMTISAGQTYTATATFSPTVSGSTSATATVTSDKSNGNGKKIGLTGNGGASKLAVSPTSVTFGSVAVGNSTTQSVNVTNSGNVDLNISAVSVTNNAYSVSGWTFPVTIPAGASQALTVAFAPKSAGTASGSVNFTSDASGGSSPLALSGTGTATNVLTASPTSLAFGTVAVGSSASQNVTLTNTSTVAITVSGITTPGPQYTVTGITLPATIAAGASASISVKFTPAGVGAVNGNISITNNGATSPITIPATATGAIVQLSASPTNFTFTSVATGTTASQNITFSNPGSLNVTISALSATGAGFSVTGFTLPLTLTPGQSSTGSIRFSPTAAGSVTGSVTVTSNAVSQPSITMSGSAVAPAPQLTISPTSVAFGSVTTGTTSSQNLTLRNSGAADLHVSALAASGTGYSVAGFILPLTLTPGQTAVGSVRFSPTAAGSVTGSVTATSDSATAAPPVALSGTGVSPAPQISVSPTSMAFGNVTTGTSSSQSLTLRNTGTANLDVTAITPAGAAYSVNAFVLPLTLAPGASAVGNVVFAPTATGSQSGSISITSNSAAAAPTVSLSGSGVAPQTFLLSASPTSLAFGDVVVGQTSSKTITLTNNGTGAISVSSANITGTGYSVTGATFPISIAAGASKTVTAAFAPQISGAANGSVSFVSNATNSPAVVTTTGNGVTPIQHTVSLNWAASTSSVIGYNIYRTTTSGSGYTIINTAVQAGTSYDDNTVNSGTTYYYTVRSVDSNGVESLDSNEAVAVVPLP